MYVLIYWCFRTLLWCNIFVQELVLILHDFGGSSAILKNAYEQFIFKYMLSQMHFWYASRKSRKLKVEIKSKVPQQRIALLWFDQLNCTANIWRSKVLKFKRKTCLRCRYLFQPPLSQIIIKLLLINIPKWKYYNVKLKQEFVWIK